MLTDAALSYLEMGLPVIPISRGSKKPVIAWKEYQQRLPSLEEAAKWPWEAIALLTGHLSGYAVVDCDTREAGEFWMHWRPWTPMVQKSKRGYHFFYKLEGVVRSDSGISLGEGLSYDVKGVNSYVLLDPTPGYKLHFGVYDSEGLPKFNAAWRPVKEDAYNRQVTVKAPPVGLEEAEKRILEQALKEAPLGRNPAGFRAAVQLRDNGFSRERADAILAQYASLVRNLRQGVYDEHEARASVRSAYSSAKREPWYDLRQAPNQCVSSGFR